MLFEQTNMDISDLNSHIWDIWHTLIQVTHFCHPKIVDLWSFDNFFLIFNLECLIGPLTKNDMFDSIKYG